MRLCRHVVFAAESSLQIQVLFARIVSIMTFITAPLCARCGTPFADVYTGTAETLVCGACLDHPPEFNRARAVFLYEANSRSLVTRFKYADRTDLAPALARWIARAGASILEDADLILPVPLHCWRLLSRTYNQSALLARRLARMTSVPSAFNTLRRTRETPTQGGLTAAARRQNMARAFKVIRPEQVEDKHVVLIDDVLTTGATLNACARVLKSAGATSVDALVVGRVPAPGS